MVRLQSKRCFQFSSGDKFGTLCWQIKISYKSSIVRRLRRNKESNSHRSQKPEDLPQNLNKIKIFLS